MPQITRIHKLPHVLIHIETNRWVQVGERITLNGESYTYHSMRVMSARGEGRVNLKRKKIQAFFPRAVDCVVTPLTRKIVFNHYPEWEEYNCVVCRQRVKEEDFWVNVDSLKCHKDCITAWEGRIYY